MKKFTKEVQKAIAELQEAASVVAEKLQEQLSQAEEYPRQARWGDAVMPEIVFEEGFLQAHRAELARVEIPCWCFPEELTLVATAGAFRFGPGLASIDLGPEGRRSLLEFLQANECTDASAPVPVPRAPMVEPFAEAGHQNR